jgi:hypothetical protein
VFATWLDSGVDLSAEVCALTSAGRTAASDKKNTIRNLKPDMFLSWLFWLSKKAQEKFAFGVPK